MNQECDSELREQIPFEAALVAGPPSSAELTTEPPPAKVVMIPLGDTLPTLPARPSAMYRSPALSTATARAASSLHLSLARRRRHNARRPLLS